MSQLRRLASQTAIYGVSSIFGRLINYALVPLHTEIFSREPMGKVSVLFSYTAIFLVIYTFGMETTFFRFANKRDLDDTYHETSTAVLLTSTLISLPLIIFAPFFARLIGYPDVTMLVRWLAIILWIDAAMAIPFARLRQENRPMRFAMIKVINIVINVGLQIFFLLGLPWLANHQFINYDTNNNLGIGYIFLANLIANLILIPLLWNYIKRIKLILVWQSFRPLLFYALPIMITGLAGMLIENSDKIMLEYILPDSFYSDMDSTAAVGVYAQTFKLGVFMMLAIQAFRYAAEPFFFSQAEDKNSPQLFARVMHYFILTGLVLLFLVSVNVDLIGRIFLRSPEFRVALYLVPIFLFGKLINGIYLNLSIWFKLTDQTRFGMYFSIIGALVTLVGNIVLIPRIGYDGSAMTMVMCYLIMAVVCYFYGQKYYPIPYNFGRLVPYFIVTILLLALSGKFNLENFALESTLRVVLSMAIVVTLFIREKRQLVRK